jgi:hypothetical protein
MTLGLLSKQDHTFICSGIWHDLLASIPEVASFTLPH